MSCKKIFIIEGILLLIGLLFFAIDKQSVSPHSYAVSAAGYSTTTTTTSSTTTLAPNTTTTSTSSTTTSTKYQASTTAETTTTTTSTTTLKPVYQASVSAETTTTTITTTKYPVSTYYEASIGGGSGTGAPLYYQASASSEAVVTTTTTPKPVYQASVSAEIVTTTTTTTTKYPVSTFYEASIGGGSGSGAPSYYQVGASSEVAPTTTSTTIKVQARCYVTGSTTTAMTSFSASSVGEFSVSSVSETFTDRTFNPNADFVIARSVCTDSVFTNLKNQFCSGSSSYSGQAITGGISMWISDTKLLCPSCDSRFLTANCPVKTTAPIFYPVSNSGSESVASTGFSPSLNVTTVYKASSGGESYTAPVRTATTTTTTSTTTTTLKKASASPAFGPACSQSVIKLGSAWTFNKKPECVNALIDYVYNTYPLTGVTYDDAVKNTNAKINSSMSPPIYMIQFPQCCPDAN